MDSSRIGSKAKYEKVRPAYIRDMLTIGEIKVSYKKTKKYVSGVF